MAVCGWCGRQTTESKECPNGSAVLRLCPDCASNGIGKTSARLLGSVPDDDAIPSTPAWIRWTAKVTLFAFLLPVLLVVYCWLRG